MAGGAYGSDSLCAQGEQSERMKDDWEWQQWEGSECMEENHWGWMRDLALFRIQKSTLLCQLNSLRSIRVQSACCLAAINHILIAAAILHSLVSPSFLLFTIFFPRRKQCAVSITYCSLTPPFFPCPFPAFLESRPAPNTPWLFLPLGFPCDFTWHTLPFWFCTFIISFIYLYLIVRT